MENKHIQRFNWPCRVKKKRFKKWKISSFAASSNVGCVSLSLSSSLPIFFSALSLHQTCQQGMNKSWTDRQRHPFVLFLFHFFLNDVCFPLFFSRWWAYMGGRGVVALFFVLLILWTATKKGKKTPKSGAKFGAKLGFFSPKKYK